LRFTIRNRLRDLELTHTHRMVLIDGYFQVISL
jgi:hypothetical protein